MQNNTFSTLFVGQNIIALKRIDSTNNYLKIELAKSTPLPEGTVIMAEEQFAGRGQANNHWHSQPGKNLTFSLLLNPVSIKPENQFRLNIAISLGINDVLSKIVGSDLKIKWPNDIYFKDNKIGGILIENILKGSYWKYAVIGIGINVNQKNFPETLKNISSLRKILHQDYDLNILLQQLCEAIELRYLELLENHSSQAAEYENLLYRFQQYHSFKVKENIVEGKIVGVDEYGRLKLLIKEELYSFGLKEVSFIIL